MLEPKYIQARIALQEMRDEMRNQLLFINTPKATDYIVALDYYNANPAGMNKHDYAKKKGLLRQMARTYIDEMGEQ